MTDVQRFRADGRVEEELRIGGEAGQSLSYALVSDSEAAAVSANIANTRLTVTLPSSIAESWASTDDVGIEASQAAADGSVVSILVEKDFSCLSPRTGDDDKDGFPHPATTKNC